MHITHLKQRMSTVAMSLSFCLMATLAPALPAAAGEVTHGEMAAAIRSAEYPCAHVLALESSGDNAWRVECNSGGFLVTRNEDGSYTVTQTK